MYSQKCNNGQIFKPSLLKWLAVGGNYWKVVKTQAFKQNLVIKIFVLPPEKLRDLVLHLQLV